MEKVLNSGLSVENPDDQRSLGAHGDAIKKILQQAKELVFIISFVWPRIQQLTVLSCDVEELRSVEWEDLEELLLKVQDLELSLVTVSLDPSPLLYLPGLQERTDSLRFIVVAHTLGSDETPSSFIPDPSKHDDDDEDEDSDAELETATRSLIFWQDGFSVEDSDLLKYEENQELLQAIQSG